MTISVEPVGYVRSPRTEVADDHWAAVESVIELVDSLPEDALAGIDEFSHAEILFHFHLVPTEKIVSGARHPRNNPGWPLVGIFAQRGKNRVNRLGSSIARIVRRDGRSLILLGLDAVDGTPVLDIKPVLAEFLPREPLRQPQWSHDLMQNYWTSASAPS